MVQASCLEVLLVPRVNQATQPLFCDPGVEPESLTPPVLAGGFFTTGATWEAQYNVIYNVYLSLFFPKKLIQGKNFHE